MVIERVKISNYRNLDGVDVYFHPDCNYIIGENNIGKSNLISLLNNVFNAKSFDDDDFANSDKEIVINIAIGFQDYERSLLGDLLTSDDKGSVAIRISQRINDGLLVTRTNGNKNCTLSSLRRISFISYESTLDPVKELKVDTKKGSGPLMRHIIEKSSHNYNDFLDSNKLKVITDGINGNYLSKIKGLKKYSISAMVSPNPVDILASMYYLSDGVRKIENTGSGVQYTTMSILNLLCQIMYFYNRKITKFEDIICENDKEKKMLPIILAVDEPEVHLHPFLRRSLIRYFKQVLSNKDDDFNDILNNLFEIDGIRGQLMVITHSTDSLIGDYRNMIRFYRNNNNVNVVSGYKLQPESNNGVNTIKKNNENQLILHFPDIKEAFYSKCAIFVEGATEYGCIPKFSEKMGYSLDDYGICVINANGESSIEPLRQLLSLFHIPSVAIYDGDVKENINSENSFFTEKPCFEFEIVHNLYKNHKVEQVKKIVETIDEKALDVTLDVNFVKKPFNKIGEDTTNYKEKKLSDVDDTDEIDFYRMYSSWFYRKKDAILGRVVGDLVDLESIPDCYINAINAAIDIAENPQQV